MATTVKVVVSPGQTLSEDGSVTIPKMEGADILVTPMPLKFVVDCIMPGVGKVPKAPPAA